MYGLSALKCTASTSSSIFAVVSEIVWRSKPVMGESLVFECGASPGNGESEGDHGCSASWRSEFDRPRNNGDERCARKPRFYPSGRRPVRRGWRGGWRLVADAGFSAGGGGP